MAWQLIASVAQTRDREITLVRAGELEILLCRWQDRLYAVRNLCSHALKPLADGHIEQGAIFCPVHGGSFSLTSGQALTRPALRPIATYPVKIQGDQVFIDVDEIVQLPD